MSLFLLGDRASVCVWGPFGPLLKCAVSSLLCQLDALSCLPLEAGVGGPVALGSPTLWVCIVTQVVGCCVRTLVELPVEALDYTDAFLASGTAVRCNPDLGLPLTGKVFFLRLPPDHELP